MQEFWLAPSHHELLRIDGPDAERFLQGQVTCDVAAVPPGGFVFGAACNNKGRVITPFVLWRRQQDFLLIFRVGLAQRFIAALRKFLPFFKCSMAAETSLHCAGLSGDTAADWLARLGWQSSAAEAAAGQETMVIPLGDDQPQFLLLADPAILVAASADPRLQMDDGSAWQAALLGNGHYPFAPEDSEQFTPQELQYEDRQYVSFSKGCYTGQEIVARMHYRGKIKKRLYRVLLDITRDAITEEVVLLDASGNPLATCSKLTCPPAGSCLALAMLPIELGEQLPALSSSIGATAQLDHF